MKMKKHEMEYETPTYVLTCLKRCTPFCVSNPKWGPTDQAGNDIDEEGGDIIDF